MRHLKSSIVWVVLMALLLPSVVSAQEAVASTDDQTPVTDQMIVFLNANTTRAADDTLFWRQFGDTSTRSGLARGVYKRAVGARGHVLKLERFVGKAEVAQLQTTWKGIAGVESVEPDVIAKITVDPNDPRYNEQWHYFAPGTQGYYGMDAIGAWNAGVRGSGAVVAVLDTGITPHPDLGYNVATGTFNTNKIAGQYDFISSATIAGDNDGRDANARDEGDGDAAKSTPSSWHGTHVAGTIAAYTTTRWGWLGWPVMHAC